MMARGRAERGSRRINMAGKQTKWMPNFPNLVGPQVRKFRMASELSQKELAARCEARGLKLARGTLAKIESRLRLTTACELFIIATVLDVPMERFFPPGFGGRRGR